MALTVDGLPRPLQTLLQPPKTGRILAGAADSDRSLLKSPSDDRLLTPVPAGQAQQIVLALRDVNDNTVSTAVELYVVEIVTAGGLAVTFDDGSGSLVTFANFTADLNTFGSGITTYLLTVAGAPPN